MSGELKRAESLVAFTKHMFERYKHDDGSSLLMQNQVSTLSSFEDPVELAVFQELREMIHFKNEFEIARFTPTRMEYWQSPVNVQAFHFGASDIKKPSSFPAIVKATAHITSTAQPQQDITFPADPVNDAEFYRLQKKVCLPVSHRLIMENSLMRCEASDHESNAEDIPSDDDFEELLTETLQPLPLDQMEPDDMGASMDESAPGSTTTSSSFSEDKSMDTVIHVKNISCKFQSRTQLEKAESVMLGLVGDAACSKSNNDANNRKDHKNFHIANDSSVVIYSEFRPTSNSTLHEQSTGNELRRDNKSALTLAQRRLQKLNIVVPTLTEEQKSQRQAMLTSIGKDFSQVSKQLQSRRSLSCFVQWEKMTN
ncbi:uncharacterized protein LOC111243109 isoform X1 [Varroa destructor]|uniref:Uncharacterized protein n=2 Tax=Varroa destructor TaxID=109461 RepID=A0A7M7IXI9_VARDE|nr:uncharacterized protein LOC111243109 isoform X1 [Varroa destructor]